jgi:hypothetical protein
VRLGAVENVSLVMVEVPQVVGMDAKAYEGNYWLSYQWHQLKEQEHARPVLTAVVVVSLVMVEVPQVVGMIHP